MKLQFYTIFIAIALLSACATPPQKVAESQPIVEVEQTPEVVLSNAQAALRQAEAEWIQNGDIERRNTLLLQAAQDFQSVEQCIQTNIIIANIEPYLNQEFQQQYAALLKSECSILLHYASGLSNALIQPSIDTMVSWLSTISDVRFTNRKEVLIAHLAALHERWDLAATVMATQLNADSPLAINAVDNLWQWYLKSSESTQLSLGDKNRVMSGFRALSQIIENSSLSDNDRQRSLQYWLAQNESHPLTANLPQGISAYLNQNIQELEKIAVLLPLSGRVQAQGNAIKEGIMSAFFAELTLVQESNPSAQLPTIHFYDTGSQSNQFADENITPVHLAQYDIVIGPLLREHVAAVRSFNLPESVMVFLNRVPLVSAPTIAENTEGNSQLEFPNVADNTAKVYFALAPEDEAKQLANLMKERGVTTPIIINNTSSVSNRMVDAFNEQWIALNQANDISTPRTVNFTDNKSLRIGITDALDVLQSQRRIRQVSNLTSEVVHSVTRNRRDVDAFVVFAQPQELELLNPIIEASISLFTERTIPVFASSYSYQHQLNKNSVRDLRNVVFVDMPFLMPTEREKELASEVDQIWNNPPSSFLRLFAFGYDAFQFSSQIQQLAFVSHTALEGKTGRLTVNEAFQVERELPSATILENGIVEGNQL